MNTSEYVRFLETKCNEESCDSLPCKDCKWNKHYMRITKGIMGLKDLYG